MKKVILIFFSFLLFAVRGQTFDPTNPDEDLLKKLVLSKINAKRVKRKGKELVLNEALQQTADQYVATFRYQRFENSAENKRRFKKNIRKQARINGYKNAFVDFHIVSQNAMNYYGKQFYYDKDDTETSTHLFMGKKPSKKEKEEPGYKAVPVKTLTYDDLASIIARNFVRDDGYFSSLNNGFDKYGFALAVDGKTIHRNKIPKVKVILIVGGNRINW